MATTPGAPITPGQGVSDGTTTPGQVAQRAKQEYLHSPETKPGFMTSEFISSIIAALGVLIAAAMADDFSAEEAWRLVSFLSIGYMISRGLAKAGIGRRSS